MAPDQKTSSLLACNVGSSTLKIRCYDSATRQCGSEQVFEGDEEHRLQEFKTWLGSLDRVTTVLHRVVHAGNVQHNVARVSPQVIDTIRHWSHLAPLHNGLTLRMIELLATGCPGIDQLVIFDSGLYAELPEVARRYALPADLDEEWPVLRYGFHGLAHLSQWRQLAKPKPHRVVTMQLGSGCSMTTWRNGRVMDTSMGFTPVEGMSMATRSGSLDPMLVLHLLDRGNQSPDSLARILQRESGMKGVSGMSGDIRELLKTESTEASLAIDLFCYQAKKQLGALCFSLGGVDAISLGGGIAENQPLIRQKIFSGLDESGIELCPIKNEVVQRQQALHSKSSKVSVMLNPVDEMAEMVNQFKMFEES